MCHLIMIKSISYSFLNNKLLPITTSLFKNYFIEFSDLRYRSDNNLFFNTIDETLSYKFSDVTENVDLRGDNTLIKGTFNQMTFIMADETKNALCQAILFRLV